MFANPKSSKGNPRRRFSTSVLSREPALNSSRIRRILSSVTTSIRSRQAVGQFAVALQGTVRTVQRIAEKGLNVASRNSTFEEGSIQFSSENVSEQLAEHVCCAISTVS